MRFIAGLLFLMAAGILIFLASPVQYYLKSKQDRLFSVWNKDIKALSQNKGFAKTLKHIAKIETHFTEPQVAGEFMDIPLPFQVNKNGIYILKISITRWIEKNHYGFMIQHELFDLDQNKVDELGRTYHVGYIF